MRRKKSAAGKLFMLALAAVATLSLVALPGCGDTGEKEGSQKTAPIKVTDFRGVELTLEKPAKRIACMLDSALTQLHMLGVVDEVVAVDNWTYENEGLAYSAKIDPRLADKSLPAVTGNIEALVGLKPDVVIIWAQHEDIRKIEEQGLKVYGVQINKFDDIYKELEDLGKMTGKEERAQELISYTKQEVERITRVTGKIPETERVKAMFVWGPTKLDVAGSTSTGHDILSKAGAVNVASSVLEEHFVAKMEQVVNWNPGAIVMWYSKNMDPADFYSDPQWKTVEAVKNQRVYELPQFFFCDLWTLKYHYSIKAVAKWLYPDSFADLDLEKERKTMIEKYYGKGLE